MEKIDDATIKAIMALLINAHKKYTQKHGEDLSFSEWLMLAWEQINNE